MITDLRGFLNFWKRRKTSFIFPGRLRRALRSPRAYARPPISKGRRCSSITSLATPCRFWARPSPCAGAPFGGLETTPEKIHQKIMEGLRNHIPPRIVKDGPCKEVILTGDDADFSRLPICTHNAKDAGPFITIGLGFIRHPEYGNNVSISRMQIYDGKTMGCRSVPPQHLGVYFREMEQKGEPVEVAFTIGNDPYVTLCSQVSGSIFLDELAVAGAWMGQPVDVVKCETLDVYVPATSEIVIEGVLLPGVRRTEGPFGEFPGYYQAVTEQPVFKLKAITHRRDPIYVTALTGPPTTDNHVMREIVLEAMLYDRFGKSVRPFAMSASPKAASICMSWCRSNPRSSARRAMSCSLFFHRTHPPQVSRRRGRGYRSARPGDGGMGDRDAISSRSRSARHSAPGRRAARSIDAGAAPRRDHGNRCNASLWQRVSRSSHGAGRR